MVMMKMGLFEYIPPHGQEDRNLHQQLQQIWEPGFQRPKRSNQCHVQVAGEANLGNDSRNEAEWGKRIHLKIVPGLEHGVCPCRLQIHHRGKIDWKSMVLGSREQIDGDRPTMKKLLADLLAKSPLGAQDLGAPTEGIRKDVEAARNKLGEQRHSVSRKGEELPDRPH